jgi:hypothetical protein
VRCVVYARRDALRQIASRFASARTAIDALNSATHVSMRAGRAIIIRPGVRGRKSAQDAIGRARVIRTYSIYVMRASLLISVLEQTVSVRDSETLGEDRAGALRDHDARTQPTLLARLHPIVSFVFGLIFPVSVGEKMVG